MTGKLGQSTPGRARREIQGSSEGFPDQNAYCQGYTLDRNFVTVGGDFVTVKGYFVTVKRGSVTAIRGNFVILSLLSPGYGYSVNLPNKYI